ncbi:DNA internalization-related competence protein ComEC/Rec2 [Marinobacterium jannaschii]|uniref:DNA internalization-related competence protein ComEC/Rec2 n=1 Tax=Marinobacterium jannaschii TaxID=64970 RepID=UPI0004876020|nr:DNA internalization-related competence protein ComEC/Rec2 [Marinobacterium jannaschii]
MIACSAGITTMVLLPVLPPLQWLCAGIIIPFCLHRLKLVGAFVFGACWALVWAHWQLDHRLPIPGRSDWVISGVVTAIADRSDGRVRFDLVPEKSAALSDAAVEMASPQLRKIRVSWYSPTQALSVGDFLQAEIRLKPPHGLSNPEAFDYELWLLQQGIDATGYIRRLDQYSPGAHEGAFVRERLERWQLERYGSDASGLVQALTLGLRNAIDDQQWLMLRASGTVHLAVISGLHIGFIALSVFWLCRRVPAWLGFNLGRALPVWLSVAIAAGYVLLAGAGLPVIRAFIMIAVFLIAELRLWRLSAWARWWAALVVVLLYMPLSPYMPGFWLSFGAVAILIWISALRLKGVLRIQWCLFIGMAPLLAYLFAAVSWVAPLVNLIAIPYVALLLAIAIADHFLSVLGLDLLQQAVIVMVDFFWLGQQWIAGFSHGYTPVSAVSLTALLLALGGSWIALQPRGFPMRYLLLLLWLPWLSGERQDSDQARFSAWVFDVGQGSAILVEAGNYRLLYDTGAAYRSGGNAAERAVLPYLDSRGSGRLDDLILSHDDIDHVGGAQLIIDRYNPRRILTGGERFLTDPRARACVEGQQWQAGGVKFEMLAGSRGIKDNDRSCVLLVSDGRCSLLLPGDIGRKAEAALPLSPSSLSWLIASHHGSDSSTSRTFLNKWQPGTVIYSAGYASRFGHPAVAVVERVSDTGARQINTADAGAVRLVSAPEGCLADGQRNLKRRFWSALPQSDRGQAR